MIRKEPAGSINQTHSILRELQAGSTKALQFFFDLYAERLFYQAMKFVNSKEIAEEIVQDVFIAVWENRNHLQITNSFEGYLFTAIKNRCISYLRQRIASLKTEELSSVENSAATNSHEASLNETELQDSIKMAIDSLPERCKIIFNLSRNSGLTYKQIAEELNISAESVKTQIGIALKRLRISLKDFLE